MTLLRAAPRPEPDELLASWLGRLACLYDVPPEALWRELAGPDHAGDEPGADAPTIEALARVAAAARLNVGALAATAVGAMLPAAPITWLRARGPVLSAVPWCVACLRDDRRRGRAPHLRRLWAAACVVVCPRHRAPLTDLCPACANRARPGFRWIGARPILVCATCGADLAGGAATGPAWVGSDPADHPPEAIAAVARLQATLLRAMRARDRAVGPHRANPSDALVNAIDALAGHLPIQFGIARPPPRAMLPGKGEPTEGCHLAELGAWNAFLVLATLAVVLAWPTAAFEGETDRAFRENDGDGEPINLGWLWARRGTALAGGIGAALAMALLHDPEIAAARSGRRAAAPQPATGGRYRRLAERTLADPGSAARLAAARTPTECRRVIGRLARAALREDRAIGAAPPEAAGS